MGNCDFFSLSTGHWRNPKPLVFGVSGGAEKHSFAVWGPTQYARAGRIEGQSSWCSAIHRHDIHVGAAVVVSRKGNGFAVGREAGVGFYSRIAGYPFGLTR